MEEYENRGPQFCGTWATPALFRQLLHLCGVVFIVPPLCLAAVGMARCNMAR